MDTTAAVAAIVGELIRQGILGLVIAAILTGWLAPKWAVDDLRTRLELKDEIIERQSALIEKMAAKASGVSAPPQVKHE